MSEEKQGSEEKKTEQKDDLREEERESGDKRIEREIRSHRKFSLAEAIGREGAFFLKGESPTGKTQQLQLALEGLIKTRLRDSEEALSICLIRRAKGSAAELALQTDSPTAALRSLVKTILGNEARLRAFVTEVDAEWGQLYGERPHFDRPGQPADADDPYTFKSVRESLAALLSGI